MERTSLPIASADGNIAKPIWLWGHFTQGECFGKSSSTDGNIAKPIWLWGQGSNLLERFDAVAMETSPSRYGFGDFQALTDNPRWLPLDGNIAKPIWLWGRTTGHGSHTEPIRWKHRQADMALGT